MLAATFGNSWKLPGSEVRLSPACLLFSWGLHGKHIGSRPHREPGNCCVMTILGPPLQPLSSSVPADHGSGSSFSELGLSLCCQLQPWSSGHGSWVWRQL